MFDQLKRRLLLLNMTIISVIILVAFSGIYIMSSKIVYDGINKELMRVSDMRSPISPPPNFKPKDNFQPEMPFKNISFVIEKNTEGVTINQYSTFVTDDSFYEAIFAKTQNLDQMRGQIKMDGNIWAYLIVEHPNSVIYAFIDVTPQQDILDNLVLVFIFVSAVTLFVVFFVSKFLTNRSIKPIKEAFEKQKQFISDASHELKTPLAVINTNVEVLLGNSNLEDSEFKWLNYIKEEVKRMSHLTQDLLYLTQMEHGGSLRLEQTTFNFSDTVEKTLLGFEAIAYEKSVSLSYEIEQNIHVTGVAEQLKQVLIILLDNAVKYTPSQGHINCYLSKSNYVVTLNIINSGVKILEQDRERLFDRFYKVDPSRNRADGSYGLGLSIAKAIIDEHHGKLKCDATLDESTSFTVKLS